MRRNGALRPRLLRRGLTERGVARSAGLAAKVLHDVLGELLVLGAGGVAKLLGLGLEVLRRGLELGPLLPDLGLGLGLLGERSLGEQGRNLLSRQGECLGIHRDPFDVAGLRLGLDIRPAGALQLHHPLPVRHNVAAARLRHRLAGASGPDSDHQAGYDHPAGYETESSVHRASYGGPGRAAATSRPAGEGWPYSTLFLMGGIDFRYFAMAWRSALVRSLYPADEPWMTSAISPPATSPSGLFPVSR